jgi:hypothetical protein
LVDETQLIVFQQDLEAELFLNSFLCSFYVDSARDSSGSCMFNYWGQRHLFLWMADIATGKAIPARLRPLQRGENR